MGYIDAMPDGATFRGEPRPFVRLVGEDGNAFAIMGRVVLALKRAGASRAHRDAYVREAQSGDYQHLLTTTLMYIREGDPDDWSDDE